MDVDYELLRLLSPVVELAREQITTLERADERCRDALEQVITHECEGMGCSSTSACSPECEASFTSRDPYAEAEYIERLLKVPTEVLENLQSDCPDCRGPLATDFFAVDCASHAVYQAEVIRDAIFLLSGGVQR
jgi:hypothetical protein